MTYEQIENLREFDPEDRLQEIKYENALYKTLAAVGVIAEQSQLNPKKISSCRKKARAI